MSHPASAPPDQQEYELTIDLYDVAAKFYRDHGGFECRGFGMSIDRELRALVDAVLDVKCHGPAIRGLPRIEPRV